MDSSLLNQISTGCQVRVEQRIVHREGEWVATVEGEVTSQAMEPTGSWFAHGQGDKLWLPRLRIKKADGEISTINLDRHSKITILQSGT